MQKRNGYTVVDKTDVAFALVYHTVLWEIEHIQENNQMNILLQIMMCYQNRGA